jgi:hypothetical protein
MRGTHGDTRMTLTQLYAYDRRRVGDTNGNNQAALPPLFVCIARGRACIRVPCDALMNPKQLDRLRIGR